jgi:hypothetical protein
MWRCCAVSAQEQPTLEDRIRKHEVLALKEAGVQGRTDLIPALEAVVNCSASPAEPGIIWAKAALAKLGVKRYLDETVLELTSTNSALFQENWKSYWGAMGEGKQMLLTIEDTQEIAFEKLAYINDPATIKFIAPYLYDTKNKFPESHIYRETTAQCAINTLRKMLKNPPDNGRVIRDPQEFFSLWQNWWELHKDYYEKLEFGQPAPPPPLAMKIAKPAPGVNPSKSPATQQAPATAVTKQIEDSAGRPWLTVVLIALAALLGGVILWRAKHREH